MDTPTTLENPVSVENSKRFYSIIEEEQRREEARGRIGPIPNDAIALVRYMQVERLCDLMAKAMEQHSYGVKELLVVIEKRIDQVDALYPFADVRTCLTIWKKAYA